MSFVVCPTKHDLVKPDDGPALLHRTLHLTPHGLFKGLIATILGFLWHLFRSNDFLFDAVDTVDSAQSPRLDELVSVGAMEEGAALGY